MRTIRYQDYRPEFCQLMQDGHFVSAFAKLQELAPLCGDDPVFIGDLSEVMWSLGDEKQALDLLHILVTRFADYLRGWLLLGVRMGNYGEPEQAIACFKKALKLSPDSLAARTELAKLEPFSPNSQQARHLRKCLDANLEDAEKIEILIVLADSEARWGSPVKAFRHWTQMNALRRLDYNTKGLLQLVDEIRDHAGDMPRAAPDPEMPRMLFITGMPRSGTTITESELAKHPDAHPLGECPALDRAMKTLGIPHHCLANPELFDRLRDINADTIQQMREIFLSWLPQSAPRDKLLITKLPADGFSIWAARLFIPELKVLHMERHPLDVALSNFRTNFATLPGYYTTLDGIADVIRATWRVRDINAALLGPDMRVQSYRALVEDKDNQIAECLAHAGLAPEQMRDTVDPDELRPIRTASVHQVRQGVNRKGLDKWRKFERQLSPVITHLGGPQVIADWEAQDIAGTYQAG